jgi:hypothetical protein
VLRRVVVTGGLALTALLISHPGHAMMAKAGPSDGYTQATIYNTGATGSCSYSIQVNLNGSATYSACQYEHGVGLLPLFLANKFFQDLNNAGPLNLLPQGICFNTGGYGTRTLVLYGNQSTPVISCDSSDPRVRSLYHDADEIWRYLNFNTDPRLVTFQNTGSGQFSPEHGHKVNGHLAKLSLALSDDAMQPLAYTHVQQGHCASPASNQHKTLIIEGGTACADSPIFVERPSFGLGPVIVPVPEYGEDGPIIIQVPTYGNPYLYGRNPYFYGVGPWTYGAGHWIFGGDYGSFPWNRFGRSGWGFGPGFWGIGPNGWGFGHGGWGFGHGGFGHGGISVGGGFGSHHTA